MNRTVIALSLLAPAAIAVSACASEDERRYDSGVNDNQMLSDLEAKDQQTICTSRAAYVRAQVDTTSLTRFWCAFTPGVLTARDDAECEQALQGCVDAFSIKIDVTVSDPNAPPPECTVVDTSTCQGTVSDYEDCVNSLVDVQLSIGTDWACGKRAEHTSPTVGVAACDKLGPTCTPVTTTPIR